MIRQSSYSALVLMCWGSLASPATHAQQQSPDANEPPSSVKREYRELAERAVSEFSVGHTAEARALFLRAHELWPSARTLRTLGMTAFELRMYPRALTELQAALSDPRRALPDDQQAQVRGLIAQASGFVGRYWLQDVPPGTELLVDGVRQDQLKPLIVSVGEHSVVARVPEQPELRFQLLVQGREDTQLMLPVAPPQDLPARAPQPVRLQLAPQPVPDRTAAITAFSVGAAGLIVGSIAGWMALERKHDVDNLDAGYRAADISTAAFITAGVGAAVGTVLWIVAPSAASDTRARSVLTLSGSF